SVATPTPAGASAPAEPEPAPPEEPPRQGPLIRAEPGVASWEERPGMAAIEGFHPFVIGVLAECSPDGARWCELSPEGALVPSKIKDPERAPILGTWPANAWRVTIEEDEAEPAEGDGEVESHVMWADVTLQRWDGRRFEHVLQDRFELDLLSVMAGERTVVARTSGAGGLLLIHDFQVDHAPPTVAPVSTSTPVEDAFESAAGGLFLALILDERMVLRPPCAAATCAERELVLAGVVRQTPAWAFPLFVARGGHSITLVAEDEADAYTYLIHYDADAGEDARPGGRWRVEATPLRLDASMMWPDGQGGLWVEYGLGGDEALWHRDARGRWREVAPPKGVVLGYANRAEPRELWALVRDDAGIRHVYATRGLAADASSADPPVDAPAGPGGAVEEPPAGTQQAGPGGAVEEPPADTHQAGPPSGSARPVEDMSE
ncbi:MAG: hypothetical protein KC636_05155, partial [Myxococcales bacterium]|nr:hypothetical protein [Myxococcales bacterium]